MSCPGPILLGEPAVSRLWSERDVGCLKICSHTCRTTRKGTDTHTEMHAVSLSYTHTHTQRECGFCDRAAVSQGHWVKRAWFLSPTRGSALRAWQTNLSLNGSIHSSYATVAINACIFLWRHFFKFKMKCFVFVLIVYCQSDFPCVVGMNQPVWTSWFLVPSISP